MSRPSVSGRVRILRCPVHHSAKAVGAARGVSVSATLLICAYTPSTSEKAFGELVGITTPELRKYLGMLHVHHLVKR
jgi:hypothetical protein